MNRRGEFNISNPWSHAGPTQYKGVGPRIVSVGGMLPKFPRFVSVVGSNICCSTRAWDQAYYLWVVCSQNFHALCHGSRTWRKKRRTAAREADLPEIFHKTWQAENPDFLLCRTRQTSACHCSSPSGLPTNCGAPLSTLPVSHRFIFVLTCAHLPILHRNGNKRFLLGTWWEQNEFDGNLIGTRGIWWELFGNSMGTKVFWLEFFENLMRTKGYWWVIDGNKRNLMGTWWEQKDIDGLLMGTRGIWSELDRNKRIFDGILMGTDWNLMGNQAPTLQKDMNHPLGACLCHPIGSRLQKIRNIHVGMLVPPNWRSSHALS